MWGPAKGGADAMSDSDSSDSGSDANSEDSASSAVGVCSRVIPSFPFMPSIPCPVAPSPHAPLRPGARFALLMMMTDDHDHANDFFCLFPVTQVRWCVRPPSGVLPAPAP